MNDRRQEKRVEVGLFVREIVGEATYSSFVMNLSSGGILLERPSTAAPPAGPVQLEIRLPDHHGRLDADPVWGLAQVVYDEQRVDDPAEASGWRRSALRFSAMADAHRERLETWLANQRGGERWEDLGQGVRVLRPG
ncbi:MAG: PilZ domain-containing protein [Sandaracinaceae bacterium]|nr:PilZ domain-containing protein [Sandaracinaceae bacterium]MBP7683024.1 PilZ domain-containing protein [Deltaproteobacteria bacterium]